MRFAASLFLTVSICLPVSAFGADIEAASHITKATVFTAGATVERHTSADLPAGASVIALKGLPQDLDTDTIHVEGQGDAGLTIVSIDSRTVPGENRQGVNPALEDKIDAARIERDKILAAIDAAEGQKASIKRYADTSPEKIKLDSKPLDFDKWPDVWRLIGKELADINENLRDLQQKRKSLDSDIAALEKARVQSGVPGQTKRDILVSVEAGQPMKAEFNISYQVAHARWAPLYDARLVTRGETPVLDLKRRASVQQTTGEDWTGIALTLSAARLYHGTAAPELGTQSLTLVDLQAEAARAAAAPMPAAPAPFAKHALEQEARLAESGAARQQLATAVNDTYDASFAVPGLVDIPRDGTVKTLTLTQRTVEPTIGAKLTPILDTSAYLETSFVNDEDVPLLPGEVVIWRDGSLIGKGRFPLVASGDKVKLGFGVDDQIKATRSPVAKRENDGGFFNSSRSETQEFKTAIKNLHRFVLRITMVDRIPVSENTAISVEPLSTNTAPTEKIIDDKRGVMGWTYDYKPGEQKDIRLGWRIRWPADRELRRRFDEHE